MEAIGGRLRAARQQARRTQKDVAIECNVSRQAVSSWERGETLPPALELMALAVLFGTSTDYLLFGVKAVPASSVVQGILGRTPAPGGEDIRPMPVPA